MRYKSTSLVAVLNAGASQVDLFPEIKNYVAPYMKQSGSTIIT